MTLAASATYQLKDRPYSSHSLLLATLPSHGRGRRVLDVGYGAGYLGATILSERGYRVTSIDSPGTSRARFPESIELVEADLDEGRFDCATCADVLEHLRRPALLRGVLAPGGKRAASLPNSGHANFRWNVLRRRLPAEDRGLFDRTHLHFYTWCGLARSAGRDECPHREAALPGRSHRAGAAKMEPPAFARLSGCRTNRRAGGRP